MVSVAEKIAKRVSDGETFKTTKGTDLAKLCGRLAIVYHWGAEDDRIRYEFADGSAIVMTAGGWDLGFDGTGCYCWQGVGKHRILCEREDRKDG